MVGRRESLALGLAYAFLDGPWDEVAVGRRGQRALNGQRKWVRQTAAAAVREFEVAPLDRPRALAAFIERSAPFALAASRDVVVHWSIPPTAMVRRPWPVVRLDTVKDVRELVGLGVLDLTRLAERRQLHRALEEGDARLHYRRRWVAKRSGGRRLVEAPKPLLKHVQRVLLREVLAHVPAHPAAHGFVTGRSALSCALHHVGQALVLRFDLEDFFTSVPAGRIYGIYRFCGYPEPVAEVLTALTTVVTPRPVLSGSPDRLQQRRLATPHLPQGAPTSPALANLAAFSSDRRLAGLAAAAGLTYTRYADDLTFSSSRPRPPAAVERLIRTVRAITVDEGFRCNEAKTVARTAGQQQRVVGIVVNERPNVDRREYDRLRALLHNAALHGPESQNLHQVPAFRQHLLGRIEWIGSLNPDRGERLRVAFDRIAWPAA